MWSLFSGDRAKRNLSRRSSIKLALCGLGARCLRANGSDLAPTSSAGLVRKIPPRSPNALSGTQFAESVASLDRHQREQAILSQLLGGNVPGFLRMLVPLKLSCQAIGGAAVAATIFVMPEYLAIGSDSDFLRIPMDLHTALAVANRFGFVLPTRRIVDAIYEHSTSRLIPQPLPAGPRMTSTAYYQLHNRMIDQQAQSRAIREGELIAGHKKDVVLTNRLNRMPGRIAIYGWHRAKDDPIQPLSTVHGASYADYSHGIRLIAGFAWVEDRFRSVYDILKDPVLAQILSDEGALRLGPPLRNA